MQNFHEYLADDINGINLINYEYKYDYIPDGSMFNRDYHNYHDYIPDGSMFNHCNYAHESSMLNQEQPDGKRRREMINQDEAIDDGNKDDSDGRKDSNSPNAFNSFNAFNAFNAILPIAEMKTSIEIKQQISKKSNGNDGNTKPTIIPKNHLVNISSAIKLNVAVEKKLHVVAVISNPCEFKTRYRLTREFMTRMEQNKDIILYMVEMIYPGQKFVMTNSKNPRHLQLVAPVPLWHKESMINAGIAKLLPPGWKTVAWVDADLDFDNVHWAQDTLKILNGECDIVQLFSHCIDMGAKTETLRVFSSAGYQYTQRGGMQDGNNSGGSEDFAHPGYAWAMTRSAYDKLKKGNSAPNCALFQNAILGSGDNIMMLSLLKKGLTSVHSKSSAGYKKQITDFQKVAQTLKFGYVPGVIRHFFHGHKKDRRYNDRWMILIRHNYDPMLHVTTDSNGILIPTKACPKGLLNEIMHYFSVRNEDI